MGARRRRRRIAKKDERELRGQMRRRAGRFPEHQRDIELPLAAQACKEGLVDGGSANDGEVPATYPDRTPSHQSEEGAGRRLHASEGKGSVDRRDSTRQPLIDTAKLVSEVAGADDAIRVVVDAQHREARDLHCALRPIEHVASLRGIAPYGAEPEAII